MHNSVTVTVPMCTMCMCTCVLYVGWVLTNVDNNNRGTVLKIELLLITYYYLVSS